MIAELISKNIEGLKAYKTDNEADIIRLDLNENPYDIKRLLGEELMGEFDRISFSSYPDGCCTDLKRLLAGYTGAAASQLAVGNGSDELLSLIMQAFINKGDKVLLHSPTFSMYRQYAAIAGAKVEEYVTCKEFKIDIADFIKKRADIKPKLQIICNPNNPTGRGLSLTELETLIKGFDGITVVDEAYFEFCGITAFPLLASNENLIITRTFSKALGLAGFRVGYMISSSEIIEHIERVRSPYNINILSQTAASIVLRNMHKIRPTIDQILKDRAWLYDRLKEIRDIEAYSTQCNFILIKADKAEHIYSSLLDNRIRVKYFSEGALKDYLRISIGTSDTNIKVAEIIEKAMGKGGRDYEADYAGKKNKRNSYRN